MPALTTNNADTKLAVAALTGATSLTVETGKGDLFPAPANVFEYFYIRVGSDAGNQVVKCTARAGDVLTITPVLAADAGVATPVMLTASAQLFEEVPRVIDQDVTITVSDTGTPHFFDLTEALDALHNVLITGNAWVTIDITGKHALSPSMYSDRRLLSPDRIKLKGEFNGLKTITSILSSSGSAGAYTVVAALSVTGDITVGDFLLVEAASGGTNPESLLGCHRVTAINPGVSVSLHCQARGNPPSGAVQTGADNVRLLKTVIEGGLEITRQGFGHLLFLVFYAGSGGGGDGIRLADYSDETDMPVRAGHGCFTQNSTGVALCGFSRGIVASIGGTLTWDGQLVISGCGVGIEADGGAVSVGSAMVTGADVGLVASGAGRIHAPDAIIAACTTGALARESSLLRLTPAGVTGSATVARCATGLHAQTYGYIGAEGVTTAGNTTDFSPAANTQGNEFGYIKT